MGTEWLPFVQKKYFISNFQGVREVSTSTPFLSSYFPNTVGDFLNHGHQFSSVAQWYLTLWEPHGLQHARFPCPSPTPEACSNSCPLSQRCHPIISSTVIPFSSLLQSFPVSGSFSVSLFFASGGQSIGTSASASVLSTNIQDSFSLGWTGLISLQFKGFSESSPTPLFKNITTSALSLLNSPTLTSIHDYWKNNSFD